MISSLEKRLLLFISLNDLPINCSDGNKLLHYIVNNDFNSIIKTFLNDLFHRTYGVEKCTDFTSFLRSIIQSFTVTCNGSYSKIDMLCVGIGCLYGFIQYNWTGPPNIVSEEYIFERMENYCREINYVISGNMKSNICDNFSDDDEEIVSNMHRWELLFIAKCIFESIDIASSQWWLLRLLVIHQKSIIHPSSHEYDNITRLIDEVKNILQKTDDKTLHILFSLETTELYTEVYSNHTKAHFFLQEALNELNLDIYFSGALGKLTRFQVRDLPQLILRASLKEDTGVWPDNDLLTYEGKLLSKDIVLNDDVRLPTIKFANTEEAINNTKLNVLHHAAILALYAVHFKTMPRDELSIEELWPKLRYLLDECRVWSLHSAVLQFRSFLEANHSRTIERALSQLGTLLDSRESPEPPITERLLLFHCSHLSAKWKLNQKTGDIFFKLGCVKSALDIFLKLEIWENLVECYNSLNMKHKAAEVLRTELEKNNDNVRIWCLLGDATDDESCYEKAWQLSNKRSWLAQKHWALFYFYKKQYAESIKHFDESLKRNSLQVQLWSHLGYSNLVVENWEQCAIAYRRYCSLEPESFEAWNNLSKAYLNLHQKERALRTLQEAVKYSYDNWKVWENMLVVSAMCKDFYEVIRCYDRLLDLKGKYVDTEILQIVVNNSALLKDDELSRSILTLFGKLTSKVTDNADVWCFYAILTNDCSTANDKREKILNFVQRAHNIRKRELAWKHSINECKKFMDTTILLLQAHNDYMVDLDVESGKQLVITAKMMLRGVISSIKKEYSDDVADDEFRRILLRLENTLNSIDMSGSLVTLKLECDN